jgi:hypothetical protein
MMEELFEDLEAEVQMYFIGNIELNEVDNRPGLWTYGLVVQGNLPPMDC